MQNIQAAGNDSDQTAHMRRLVLGFAGRISYMYIVGNTMSRLIYSAPFVAYQKIISWRVLDRYWGVSDLGHARGTLND